MSTQPSAWSRLRWPFKAVIIAVPILAAVWGVNEFGLLKGTDTVQTDPSRSADDRNTDREESGRDENRKEGNKTSSSTDRRSFAYQPETPVNGTLKGVVEVGSTGFNSFVVEMDKERRYVVRSKDFGESLVYEGLATTDDIRAGLKKYLSQMFDRGVRNKDMHFVISSGAQKNPKTQTISSELKKMGYVVNLVTPEQEGRLALKSAQPPQYKDNSFVVDIGSGNTKVSWYEGESLKAIELPGAKYFEKGTPDEEVYNEVKAAMSKVPADKREVCFMIGGAPFEMAKETRDGEERFTVLNVPSEYKSDKAKTKAGVNIYKAIADATGCDTFVFDWDANFTIGFLLGLPV